MDEQVNDLERKYQEDKGNDELFQTLLTQYQRLDLTEKLRDLAQDTAKNLDSEDNALLIKTMKRLAAIGAQSELALSSIFSLLESSDHEVRWEIPPTLTKINSPDALPRIYEALNHEDSYLRQLLYKCLRTLEVDNEDYVQALCAVFHEDNPEASIQACAALKTLGPKAQSAIPHLIGALHLEYGQQNCYVDVLSGLGVPHSQLISELNAIQVAPYDRPTVLGVMQAYQILGAEAKSAAARLFSIFQSSNRGTRSVLIQTLRALEYTDSELIAGIQERLSDLHQPREHYASALVELNVESPRIVPILISLLTDSDEAIRAESASQLGLLGSGAKSAIPALKASLKDDDETVRACALEALNKVGSPEDLRENLIPLLFSQETDVVMAALEFLESNEALAHSLLPSLLSSLQHNIPRVRIKTLQILEKIDLENDSIHRAVGALLRDKNKQTRKEAWVTIEKRSPSTATMALISNESLEFDDSNIRRDCLNYLEESPDVVALTGLIACLDDPKWTIRQRALNLLGAQGEKAKEAIPVIEKLKEDKYKRVREAAEAALVKIAGINESSD